MQIEESRCGAGRATDWLPGPLVSILTPTYNHAKFISAAIESVLAQTYSSWELIVVDDGSSDRTADIVERYTDPRICLIRQPHRGIEGLGKNYNLALSLARGELIAILEGDDFWPPDKLAKQVLAFEDPEVVITWGIGVYIDVEGRVVGHSKVPEFQCIEGRSAFRALLIRNFLAPTVTVMVRRNLLAEVGFVQPRGSPFVDYPTWFELTEKGRWCFINEELGFWRVHSGQMTRKLWPMWRGEIATYNMLRRNRRLGPLGFLALVSLATAKAGRRYVLARRSVTPAALK